ncbi:MAG TPA: NAD(P)H-binding protein [Mucilaginibacter sp.]|nr:NAD(P)H-binding protein [Mucilaginibacter sp.]
MHILILGPTGRTGRLLVQEALNRGHKVNVLVGHKGSLLVNPDLVTVFEGTALNKYTLAEAMHGCDAVLSTLNISRVSDFPWAKLRTSIDFLSLSMKNIIVAATEQQVNRIIVTTAWGVAETRKDIPFWFRFLVDHSNIRYPYLDHERVEEMLEKSDLDYTAVRPTGLTNSKEKKEIKVSLNNIPKPSIYISRQNVALFMLDILENNLYVRQCPVISEK